MGRVGGFGKRSQAEPPLFPIQAFYLSHLRQWGRNPPWPDTPASTYHHTAVMFLKKLFVPHPTPPQCIVTRWWGQGRLLSLPAATSTHFRSPMLFHNLRTTALLDARNCTRFTRAPIWCFRSTFARGQYRMLLALDYFTMFQQKSQMCVFTLGSLVITALFTSSDLWVENFQKYASWRGRWLAPWY